MKIVTRVLNKMSDKEGFLEKRLSDSPGWLKGVSEGLSVPYMFRSRSV